MIYRILLIACCLILTSCVTLDRNPQPHCVINAIYCAWTWGTFKQDRVRIAVTHIDSRTDHSQAQALVDGRWVFLTEQWTGNHMEIVPWTRHYPQEPYRYLYLKDWIAEQLRYANQGD